MSWLDSILAVPTIGIKTRFPLKVIANLNHYMEPLIDELEKKHSELKLHRVKEPWAVAMEASGFTFSITHERIAVAFKYNIVESKKPGAFPNYDIPKLKLYSELVQLTRAYMKDMTKSLDRISGITYEFIGIVAEARLDPENLPPGVSEFMRYLGKPWGQNMLDAMDSRLTSRLSESERFFLRCHHLVRFKEDDSEDGLILNMDWQKVYKEPIPFTSKNVMADVDSSMESALSYFEKFGEGDLNYE